MTINLFMPSKRLPHLHYFLHSCLLYLLPLRQLRYPPLRPLSPSPSWLTGLAARQLREPASHLSFFFLSVCYAIPRAPRRPRQLLAGLARAQVAHGSGHPLSLSLALLSVLHCSASSLSVSLELWYLSIGIPTLGLWTLEETAGSLDSAANGDSGHGLGKRRTANLVVVSRGTRAL